MVRNTDGLILITDINTGAWFFKMDGFNGWNGEDWAMPNISSAQDWDHGPPVGILSRRPRRSTSRLRGRLSSGSVRVRGGVSARSSARAHRGTALLPPGSWKQRYRARGDRRA